MATFKNSTAFISYYPPVLNSLTAIGAHERQLLDKPLWWLVTSTIFVCLVISNISEALTRLNNSPIPYATVDLRCNFFCTQSYIDPMFAAPSLTRPWSIVGGGRERGGQERPCSVNVWSTIHASMVKLQERCRMRWGERFWIGTLL
jgi:hypothetical protein